MKNYIIKKPNWIKVKLPTGKKYKETKEIVNTYNLNTICQSGGCPNIGECWGNGVATFMILGNICTRSCKFCSVKTGRPKEIDLNEPKKVSYSIKKMGVKHVVITSVDRDDLNDMGSILWLNTIKEIKKIKPKVTIEALIPDFQGKKIFLDRILESSPEIISHNIETVKRLSKKVRVQAKYNRSIEVLKYLKSNNKIRTKSGIMLGLGEKELEVIETMNDIKNANVDIITIGQYLQPTKKQLPVKEFISLDQFKKYKIIGIKMGFMYVESGPLVRSSYHANNHIK